MPMLSRVIFLIEKAADALDVTGVILRLVHFQLSLGCCIRTRVTSGHCECVQYYVNVGHKLSVPPSFVS